MAKLLNEKTAFVVFFSLVAGPGSVTLVEDITGKGHSSRVLGSDDVHAVVVKLDS